MSFVRKMMEQGYRFIAIRCGISQQLEALDEHRRKGNQKMIVEHIHVNDGGQC